MDRSAAEAASEPKHSQPTAGADQISGEARRGVGQLQPTPPSCHIRNPWCVPSGQHHQRRYRLKLLTNAERLLDFLTRRQLILRPTR